MEKTIISSVENNFKDKTTGEQRTMWKVYLMDDLGNVGSLYTSYQHVSGEVVELGIGVNKDGKFTVKIIEPQNN